VRNFTSQSAQHKAEPLNDMMQIVSLLVDAILNFQLSY